MRMRTTGVNEVKLFLQQIGKRTSAAMRDEMIMVANDAADIARDMTPEDIDSGALMESIRVSKQPSSSHRFYVAITAGGDNINKYSGQPTSSYAAIVHENYENYATGEASARRRARKEAETGQIVGSKFLERALDQVDQTLAARLGRVLTLIGGYEQ